MTLSLRFSKKIPRTASDLLTDKEIRNAKSREKEYKLFDGKGLYLLVTSSGSKYWRLKYYFGGIEKKLTLGVYPFVSLADARKGRNKAREQLANGVDPNITKKLTKRSAKIVSENTFQAIACEWHAKYCKAENWGEEHGKKMIRLFERDIFPWIGNRPIAEITTPEVLDVIERIAKRSLDTAHRAKQNCRRVFLYAIATNRAKHDPCSSLEGASPPIIKKHFPSITEPKADYG